MNSIAGIIPKGANIGALQPGSNVSTHSIPKYTITYGTFGDSPPTIDGIALVSDVNLNIIILGVNDIRVYVQNDFTYDTLTGIITPGDNAIFSTAGALPDSTISSGSGTLYWELFGITITAPSGSGPYKIIAAPAVGGSQNFAVCLAGPSISGPWGI